MKTILIETIVPHINELLTAAVCVAIAWMKRKADIKKLKNNPDEIKNF